MANTIQARKRARQAEQRRKRTQALHSRVRTAVKKVEKAIADGDASAARSAFQAAVPELDTMVTKKILHRSTAARYKHRLNQRIKGLATTS